MHLNEVLRLLITAGLLAFANSASADFDKFNPDDGNALCYEMSNDPLNIGYPFIIGQTDVIRNLLNDRTGNPGGETGPQELTPEVILGAISFGDYKKTSEEGRSYLALFAGQRFGTNLEPFRTQLLEVLPKGFEFTQRSLSRAEVLFGQGTVISSSDVSFVSGTYCPLN